MSDRRWCALMNASDSDDKAKLTQAEIEAGWHFCPDWDFLLIGPECPEIDACHCHTVPVKG